MSSEQQQNETVEDTPQFRSVMMAGPLSAPPMPRSFATMPPAKAIRASAFDVKPVIAPKRAPVSTSAVWKVGALPSLPAAYFLERSSVYVDAEPQRIANTICDALRLESIATSYDDMDKNVLYGETLDCMKFAVRLFSDKSKVVVEVQRRCGCSFQYRECARSILRSAKTLQATPVPKRSFTIPKGVPPIPADLKKQQVEEGLNVSVEQLESSKKDSQLIGMEGLEHLTSGSSASLASDMLVASAALSHVLESAQASPEDESYDSHNAVMQRKAFTVLANVLSSLEASGKLADMVATNPVLRSSGILSALTAALKDAATRQHEASQAARCIRRLLIDGEIKSSLAAMGTKELVGSACSTAASCNLLLETECQALRLMLQ